MAKIDLDSLGIEELASLRDHATEKLAEKVAARQAELEAELEKLSQYGKPARKAVGRGSGREGEEERRQVGRRGQGADRKSGVRMAPAMQLTSRCAADGAARWQSRRSCYSGHGLILSDCPP